MAESTVLETDSLSHRPFRVCDPQGMKQQRGHPWARGLKWSGGCIGRRTWNIQLAVYALATSVP